jgi:hypothetical protein
MLTNKMAFGATRVDDIKKGMRLVYNDSIKKEFSHLVGRKEQVTGVTEHLGGEKEIDLVEISGNGNVVKGSVLRAKTGEIIDHLDIVPPSKPVNAKAEAKKEKTSVLETISTFAKNIWEHLV